MISPKVMSELHQAKLVPTQFTVPKPGEHAWSLAEQRRFWEAIQHFPQGPWTAIAAFVGSKTTRQAMTHAQKLRQKLSRWKRRVCSDYGSSSSVSASETTPVESSNESHSPLLSPTEYGEIAKLSMLDHIAEQSDMDGDGCEPMHVKVKLKDEVQQIYDAHDDRYLEHLLSDIEPVLENVAHFTHASPSTDHDNVQAAYFMHHKNMATSENKTRELSMGNPQHQNPTYYQHLQLYYSPSASAAMH